MKSHRNLLASLVACLALMFLSSHPAARGATETMFPDTVTPAAGPQDDPYEMGTVFRASTPGQVTAVRVFSLGQESGDHVVRIWRNADNAVIFGPVTWNYGGDNAWISLPIAPVAIDADADYTVVVSVLPNAFYPFTGSFFTAAGGNGQHLSYPANAGVFADGPGKVGQRPLQSFNSAFYFRDIVFTTEIPTDAVMRVTGNGVGILDGAASPSVSNGTDLGGKAVGEARVQTFTITNSGVADLTLTGNPAVAVAGAEAGDFVVTTQPATTVVPPGGATTFTVQFTPSAVGTRNATLIIAHADSPANPFDFALGGTGLSLGGGAGVIGNDSPGAFSRGGTEIQGNRFSAPVNMQITELRALVLPLAGTFKCAVYSDNAGVADRLLRSSVAVVGATNGWNTFPLTEPLDLVGGDFYWLVIWSDSADARVQADTTGTYSAGNYSYAALAGEFPDPISMIVGTSDPAVRTYCIYAEGAPAGIATGPEMDLRGNGKLMVSGDPSPSALDGTYFGSLSVGSGFQDSTFTITNAGDAPLALTGTPLVRFTGLDAGDFTVTSPPASPIAPGDTATFTVRFDPSARGLRAATVTITNNDSNENPYTFSVQGGGVAGGRESLFPDTKTLGEVNFDDTYYELGTVFRASLPGKITHLRVYSLASESGDHTARLWRNSDNTVIGGPYIWNYGGVTGWIEFDILDVDIEADTDYTVSISTEPSENFINYPNQSDMAAGGNNGLHLSYPVDAGKFTETRDARPTSSFNHANYGRDILFVPAAPPPESLFPDAKTLADVNFDGSYYELGTVFRASLPGKITHLRVYSLATESGDHTARLWRNSDNTVIGGPYIWNYGGVTGWIELDILDVDIEADTDYTVSISNGTSEKRNYPNQSDMAAGGDNGLHLSYPVDAGKFTETRDARPTSSFNHANYGRDIVFVPGTESGDTTYRFEDVTEDFFFVDDLNAGIDFGIGAWIGFLNGAGMSRSANYSTSTGIFTLPAGKVLKAIRLSSTSGGIWRISDGVNPERSGTFTDVNTPVWVVTDWQSPAATITVEAGLLPGDGYIDDIAYGEPSGIAPVQIREIKADMVTGNVVLRWIGGQDRFQVLKATSVMGPFLPVSGLLSGQEFTDAGALGLSGQAYYRVRQW